MSRLLAISDIHGCLTEFEELLHRVDFNKEDKLIVLGDLVDRGPQNMATVLKIVELKNQGYNVITIRGNHEELFLYGAKKYKNKQDLLESPDFKIFEHNGTILSLLEYYQLSPEEKEIIIKEILTQPYHHVENDFLFVHAGVQPNVDLGQQTLDNLTWIREEFVGEPHNLPYIVVFGHTPTFLLSKDGKPKIWEDNDKIGIDCGAVFGGNLACLDLTNNVKYYVKRGDFKC